MAKFLLVKINNTVILRYKVLDLIRMGFKPIFL